MKSGWVKLNKLAISVWKIDGQFCIPLTSPIHLLFRVKGSGITMSLFITSFALYSYRKMNESDNQNRMGMEMF